MAAYLPVRLPRHGAVAAASPAIASVAWTSATWTWRSRSALRLTSGRAARSRSASAKCSPAGGGWLWCIVVGGKRFVIKGWSHGSGFQRGPPCGVRGRHVAARGSRSSVAHRGSRPQRRNAGVSASWHDGVPPLAARELARPQRTPHRNTTHHLPRSSSPRAGLGFFFNFHPQYTTSPRVSGRMSSVLEDANPKLISLSIRTQMHAG